MSRAKRLPRAARGGEIERVIRACTLGEMRRRLVGKLSKGFRQRVGLAQALLGDPQVLILDEPTSGLDPEQVSEIRELVKGLRGQRTIVFSSHILSEVAQVAQRVVIINRGRIVAEDRPDGLARRIEGTVTVWLRAEAPASELRAVLSAVPGLRDLAEVDGRWRFHAQDEGTVREASRAVAARGWILLELARESLSLEEIFLRLVHVGEEPPHAARGAGA